MARTSKGVIPINTGTMATGGGQAVVNIGFTIGTSEAWTAAARVPSHSVYAGASMLTGVGGTVVNVDVALSACEPLRTAAPIVIDEVAANATVVAGARGTLIQIFFTVLTRVPCRWEVNL